jgi:L-ascorbate metabolism protein UlaG (beta-lactamase superfamily)
MHPFEDLTVPAGAVGIHWFGQSSFALKTPIGTIVHIDPYFPRERPADRFVHSRPPLEESTLHTDGVLLTHNHLDHTYLPSLQRINAAFPGIPYIGPEESMEALEAAGFTNLQTVAAGDETDLADLTIHAVFAKPPAGAPDDGIAPPDVTHLGYVIDTGAVRLYVSGDPINTFGNYEELLAPIRALRPDIGFMTTHPNEGEFPFFDGSAAIVRELGLKTAVPAHYSCFVKRDYDPNAWAAGITDAETLIIGYNQSVVYKTNE